MFGALPVQTRLSMLARFAMLSGLAVLPCLAMGHARFSVG